MSRETHGGPIATKQVFRVEGKTVDGEPFASFVVAVNARGAREAAKTKFKGILGSKFTASRCSWHDVEDILEDPYNVYNVYGEPAKTTAQLVRGQPVRLIPPYHKSRWPKDYNWRAHRKPTPLKEQRESIFVEPLGGLANFMGMLPPR